MKTVIIAIVISMLVCMAAMPISEYFENKQEKKNEKRKGQQNHEN